MRQFLDIEAEKSDDGHGDEEEEDEEQELRRIEAEELEKQKEFIEDEEEEENNNNNNEEGEGGADREQDSVRAEMELRVRARLSRMLGEAQARVKLEDYNRRIKNMCDHYWEAHAGAQVESSVRRIVESYIGRHGDRHGSLHQVRTILLTPTDEDLDEIFRVLASMVAQQEPEAERSIGARLLELKTLEQREIEVRIERGRDRARFLAPLAGLGSISATEAAQLNGATIDRLISDATRTEEAIQRRTAPFLWCKGNPDGSDNLWAFDSIKPATRTAPPPIRPGTLPAKLHIRFKKTSEIHLWPLMQYGNAYICRWTVEFDEDVSQLDPRADWTLILDRRAAAARLFRLESKRQGILAVLEGLETHGATKNNRGSRQKVADVDAGDKATGKKKRRTISDKKRNHNPRLGGLDEVDDEDEEVELQAQQMEQQAEQDAEQAQEADLRAEDTRAEAARGKIHESLALLKDLQRKRVEEAVKKKKGELSAAARKELENSPYEEVNLMIGVLRDLMDDIAAQLESGKYDNIANGPLIAKGQFTLYEKALKSLQQVAPNRRRNFAHLEVTAIMRQDKLSEPYALAKRMSAPLVLRHLPPLADRLSSTPLICIHCDLPGVDKPVERACAKPTEYAKNCVWGYACVAHSPDRASPCGVRMPFDYFFKPDTMPSDEWKQRYPDEARRNQYGALDFSLDHNGGLDWRDVKPQVNLSRSLKNWMQMLLYSLKSVYCKLTEAWLRHAGRFHRRFTVLHFIGHEDERWNTMFRNYIVALLTEAHKLTPSGRAPLSLSIESDAWAHTHDVDPTPPPRKKDKDFFVDRLVQYMRANRMLLSDNNTVMRVPEGFERSVELAHEHFYATDASIAPHQTLMGHLMSLETENWRSDIISYGQLFHANPDMRGALPRFERVYEVIEVLDGWLCMFPLSTHGIPIVPEWLTRTQTERDQNLAYKLLRKAHPATKAVVDRLLGKNGMCVHGLRITLEQLTRPPAYWFRAIGKYYPEPTVVTEMARDPRTGQTLSHTIVTHASWGKVEWRACMTDLRQLLFRPQGDGQRWPWFHGPPGTGKTSFAEKIFSCYYLGTTLMHLRVRSETYYGCLWVRNAVAYPAMRLIGTASSWRQAH